MDQYFQVHFETDYCRFINFNALIRSFTDFGVAASFIIIDQHPDC